MSKTCGIEISGSEAIIVLLEGTRRDFEIIETTPLKIKLTDHSTQVDIRSFYIAISNFLRKYAIDSVFIKSGSTEKYSSDPAGFKIESLIQMTEANVEFIISQTVAAFWKKVELDFSEITLKKYQHHAFKLAYFSLGA